MQLLLSLDDQPTLLADIHRRLLQRFGPQGPYVLLDPLSQLVMAIVSVRTHSDISVKAFLALLVRFGGWEALRDAPVAEIQEAIGGVTYAERKAPDLKAALEAITAQHGRLTLDMLDDLNVPEALRHLERLRGVGRKVAAATLNLSTLRKAALVVDTHMLRIVKRLAIVDARCDTCQAYDHLMALAPADWMAADFDQHHQLMKELGRQICRAGWPACHACPLNGLCPTAAAKPRLHRPQTPRADRATATRPLPVHAGPIGKMPAASVCRRPGRSN